MPVIIVDAAELGGEELAWLLGVELEDGPQADETARFLALADRVLRPDG